MAAKMAGRGWRPRSAAMIAAALAAGLYGLAASPVFSVQEVAVRGVDDAVARRIAARLAWRRGTNLLAVEARDVAAAAADEPRVLEARLVRRLPTTLEVEVRPREPVAQVAVGERFWEVDRQGLVLGVASRPGALPVVTGAVQPGEALMPARPGPPALVEAAALVGRLAPVLGDRLAGLHVDPSTGERWVYLAGGSVIRWGEPGPGAGGGPAADARRLEVLAALLQQLPVDRPFEADLRDPGRATWKPR